LALGVLERTIMELQRGSCVQNGAMHMALTATCLRPQVNIRG
jgi:hypothetical protein